MRLLGLLFALALLALPAAPARAAVTVDPATGGTYTFLWNDLGPIDEINFAPQTEWSVTAPVDSTITFSVLDC